ncbi:MAG: TonB-dependent receptor, partial [Burkholderiales bacterium]
CNSRRAAAVWLLASATLANAQTAPTLNETVVTATRTPQPLAEVLADVSIIDRDTIERSGARGIADVLARVPGIEFSRNGGPGNVTSVFLRGAESRHTAVYVDGVRIDSQATGGAIWESIPLALVDRIEVLRGSAAAIYGSDAIGGVVQIFTKKGEQGAPKPFVSLGVGSDRTAAIEAGVSGAGGRFDYALSAAHQRSDGFNSRIAPTANPDDDGYKRSSATTRIGFKPAAGQRIEATALLSELNSQYDGFAPGVDDRNHHRLRTLGLNWQSQWTARYNTRVSLTDSASRYESTPSPYLTETRLRGYLWQNEYRIDRQLLTATLERREDYLENAPIDAKRHQDGIALGWGYAGPVHTLQLNARHDRDSEFGGQTTGGAAYGYGFTKNWRANVAASTSFRAPTLYQRFSEYGVRGLVPEKGRNVELGLRYTERASSFGVVAYRNRLTNLIAFGAAGGCASAFGCYENTAKAKLEGITVSGEQRVGALGLRGSLDFQNPRDLDTGHLLARRSKRHATLGADWRAAGWILGAETQLSAPRYDNSANTVKLAGYGLVNLYVTTRIGRDWSLLARVDNVADQPYELANTYATSGRKFWFGLKWAPL